MSRMRNRVGVCRNPAAGLEQVADEYCERKMIAFSYLGMTDHCAVIT
jgi:hypothetical protein